MLSRNLKLRSQIIKCIRNYFDKEDFIEVETPVRIAAPAPEVHIDCPASGNAFLRASPELEMKGLLSEGLKKLYQIGPCFREGECGSRHQPEFTMLEWYRANADYKTIMEDAKEIINIALPEYANNFECITVEEAYKKYANWNPFNVWDGDRFDYDMAEKIEPSLPRGAVFLIDYPAQAASLSKIKQDNIKVAERWELYVNGIELANAFTELTDAEQQRMRFEEACEMRRKFGEADYPMPERFLKDLQFMPSAGGAALGIDRLIMLVCKANSIDEVRCFCQKPGKLI